MRATRPRTNRHLPPLLSLWGGLMALLTLAFAVGGGAPRAARADATTYSTTRRQFKVGILLIESTIVAGQEPRGPENPDPYVFYIADARTDIKPQNWEFVNPLAPPTVTAEIRDRWIARDPGRPYEVGQKVDKNMAAYWEVSLTRASVQELLQFDLLFITNHRVTSFSPQEREKLRKLVDSGGVVWIEDCGNMLMDPVRPFFLDQLQFTNNGAAGNPNPQVNVPDHPILTTPYQLSSQEIANLGDKNYGGFVMKSFAPNATLPTDAAVNIPPNPEILVNVVGNGNVPDVGGIGLPYIAAGSYGSGAVIATSSDSGCDINDYAGGVNVGSGGNSGAYCGPNIITAHVEDLKFLYNMVTWGGANNAYRRNNRRTAASFESVGAPLVRGFSFDNALTLAQRPGDVVQSRSAPLIIKDTLFVTGSVGGAGVLRAYDLSPFSDRDRDGNPDDGIPDVSLGLPYDEIWRGGVGGGGAIAPSPPVYGSVYNGAGGRVDRLFVTGADGTLFIATAFPVGAGGVLGGSTVITPVAGTGGTYDPGANQGVAPAPVYNENKVYQVQPNGQVRCIDANTGTILWTSFRTAPAGITLVPTGTPTLGFSRQTAATGFAQASVASTNDLMLYVPVLRTDSGGNVQGTILSYWVGTRNEVQIGFPNNADGQGGRIATRVGGGQGGPQKGQLTVGQGVPYVVPKVRIFAGDPITDPTNPDPNRRSARDYYALGTPTTAYQTTTTPAIAPDGTVQIQRVNGAYPEARSGSGADILIAVDYDVVYVEGGATEPPAYGSNQTQIGARPGAGLTVPFYLQDPTNGNLTTPAFSPEDSVIYGAQQQWVQGGGAGGTPARSPILASVFAVNEQEGDAANANSRMRWRFGLINDFTQTAVDAFTGAGTPAPYDTSVVRTVDQAQVTDIVPLRNFLVFDPAWPNVTTAAINRVNNGGGLVPTPEALRDIRVVGSPVVTNDGITYVMAQATSYIQVGGPRLMSVLMAIRTNPEITLSVPEPFDEAQGVTISQADTLSDPANQNAPPVTVSANQQIGQQVDLDGSRGRIVIKNFRAGNGRLFNAAQSFVVRYTPRGRNAEIRYVVSPVDTAQSATYGEASDAAGGIGQGPTRGGYTPLLYYYVLPGKPTSSPTLIGDFIYYRADITAGPAAGSYVFAVDANPAERDPQVRVGLAENVPNVVTRLDGNATKVNHVRMAQPLNGVAPAAGAGIVLNAPPVGAQNNLVANTAQGTFNFTTGVTLIADANRLIETGADASALWTLDSAVSRLIAGGDLPIYDANGGILNPPATGRVSISRSSLSKPQLVRRVVGSDYLIADTGNNRVLRTDRSGNITWSLADIADPYGLLSAGEPTSLSGPTDVQFYTQPTVQPDGTPTGGYEIHYIVADANNYRIVEVADYYDRGGRAIDPPGTPAGEFRGKHVLVWTTRTSSQGERLRFTGVQRFLGADPTGTFFGQPYITATVSNTEGGSSGGRQAFTGSGIVSLRYVPFNTAFFYRDANGVPTGSTVPPWTAATAAAARAAEPPRNGLVELALNQVFMVEGGVRTPRKIDVPTYFQQINVPAPTGGSGQRTLFLVCDAAAAYVLELKNGPVRAGGPNVQFADILWMFTQADYNRLNGVSPGTTYTGPANTPVADAPSGTIITPAVYPQFFPTGPRLNFPQVTGGAITPDEYANLPRFRPASIQLLPSGNYLITNAGTGRSSLFDSGQFVGEVLEVQPFGLPVLFPNAFGDTGRGGAYGGFSVPRIDRGTNTPPAANILNKQVMGNPESNTGLLEQPLSASRP